MKALSSSLAQSFGDGSSLKIEDDESIMAMERLLLGLLWSNVQPNDSEYNTYKAPGEEFWKTGDSQDSKRLLAMCMPCLKWAAEEQDFLNKDKGDTGDEANKDPWMRYTAVME